MADPIPANVRYHDLDAVRAVAMLLGIVLHAALAYTGGWWIVRDVDSWGGFGTVTELIHGFRMPLFFLVSGYFTAMLWRRRGMAALVWHRTRRIVFPFVLGWFTILPLTTWVNARASQTAGRWSAIRTAVADGRDGKIASLSEPIRSALRGDDLESLRALIARLPSINTRLDKLDQPPLVVAAWYGAEDCTRWLLDQGADPNAVGGDRGSALHAAAFFGWSRLVDPLMDAGADADLKQKDGLRPIDVMGADAETTVWIMGLVGVKRPLQRVLEGRGRVADRIEARTDQVLSAEVRDRLASFGSKDGTVTKRTAESRKAAGDAGKRWFGWLVAYPLWHHLWFLYFLIIFIAAFAILASLATLLPLNLSNRVCLPPVALFGLVPMTFLTQRWMVPEGYLLGPQTSVSVIPMFSVVAHYAVFFFVGAVWFGRRPVGGSVRREAVSAAVYGVFAAGVALAVFKLPSLQRALAAGPLTEADVRNAASALYAWSGCLGFMHLFAACVRRESYAVRWISDSSYWLYLAHLPLVLALQAWLVRFELAAPVKFTIVTGATLTVLWVSYRYVVRYTALGSLLNGPRTRRDRRTRRNRRTGSGVAAGCDPTPSPA